MAITKRRYKRKKRKKTRKKRKKTRKKRKKTRKKRGGSKNTEKHLKSIKVKIEEINETKKKVKTMSNKQFKEWRLELDERGGEKNPCGPTRKKCISTLNNNLGIMALQRDALIKMGQEEERRRALEIIPASRHVSTNNANEFLRALLDYEPKGGDDLELVKGKMYRGVSLTRMDGGVVFPLMTRLKL
jgi:hypothetical protein